MRQHLQLFAPALEPQHLEVLRKDSRQQGYFGESLAIAALAAPYSSSDADLAWSTLSNGDRHTQELG